MKILESYKKIAKSMLIEHAWDRKFGEPLPTLEDVMREAEVDDDTEIKFKVTDKDGKPTGETDSMPASSAKKMEKTHPAKIEYDRLAKKGGEDKPEEPSGKLSGGDFTRKSFTGPQGDEPEGMYGDDEDDRAPGEPDWDDEEMSGDEIRRLAKLVSKSKGDDKPEHPADAAYKKAHEPRGIPKPSFARRTGRELETITVDGKKYKAVKESREGLDNEHPKKHALRLLYERIGGK